MDGFIKLLLFLLIVSCSVVTRACAADIDLNELVPVYGMPPSGSNNWIRIIWRGPMLHPIMPGYFVISKRPLPRKPITQYVELKAREYGALQKFTYSSDCSAESPEAARASSHEIEVDEFANNRVRKICLFSPDSGCRYLFGLAALASIDWSRKNTLPIFEFESELGCSPPLTPWHYADGR
ncbi:MAG TPA: hypothetical protein VIJ85_09850 [Rhizomicrobium sp.]